MRIQRIAETSPGTSLRPAGIKPSLADYLSQSLSNDPDIERRIPRERAPAIAGIPDLTRRKLIHGVNLLLFAVTFHNLHRFGVRRSSTPDHGDAT